eukprot:1412706-Alexandrium_andersonii.AAC.1
MALGVARSGPPLLPGRRRESPEWGRSATARFPVGGWSAWAGGAAQRAPDPRQDPWAGPSWGQGWATVTGPGPTARVQCGPTDVARRA